MTNILNGVRGRRIIIGARENRISGLKNGHCPRESNGRYILHLNTNFNGDSYLILHVEEEATNDDNIEDCRHPRIYPFNVNIPA